MSALLVELEKAKYELTRKHSFQSVGAFDGISCTVEGSILFETLLLTRAINWLAQLSINPSLEVRRGTLSISSELQCLVRPVLLCTATTIAVQAVFENVYELEVMDSLEMLRGMCFSGKHFSLGNLDKYYR
jgi:hypothetical protein